LLGRWHGDPELQGEARSDLAAGKRPRDFPPDLVAAAKRKLRAMEAAGVLGDLAQIPGNRLEKLKGDRAGQWSIRINDQWRIASCGKPMERMMSKSSTITDADPSFRRLPPLHPGEMLREEFLVPLGLSPYALAKAIGIPRTRIERLVREETAVTADTALRLGRYFNMTPQFWMGLQTHYELEVAERALKRTLGRIEPRPAVEAAE
jgi:addiction module HigA family antidote